MLVFVAFPLYAFPMRHGFLFIHKPVGKTSHDIVFAVRRALSEKSVGHLGTLDPEASGLLVLAVGAKALKCIELFMGARKEYSAELCLGSVSTTYDREGVIATSPAKAGWLPPEHSTLARLIADRFVGALRQVPPAFSAVHVGGERAYRKAMRGEAVDIPAREVHISACDILKYDYPSLSLRIECSSGTYIRSLAHDLGQVMGSGAYLSGLERTKVGDWTLEQSVKLDQLNWTDVVPLKEILKPLPSRMVTDEEWEDISHGRVIEGSTNGASVLVAWHKELPVAILEDSKKVSGALKPRKVL